MITGVFFPNCYCAYAQGPVAWVRIALSFEGKGQQEVHKAEAAKNPRLTKLIIFHTHSQRMLTTHTCHQDCQGAV
ncbi:hypothetical protein WJX77_011198 [Trebouxia sp. C0004]